METYHLLHLALSWPTHNPRATKQTPPPISSQPAVLSIADPESLSQQLSPVAVEKISSAGTVLSPQPVIRAAAAQMVFAARKSKDFIAPEQVESLEGWCAHAMLQALASFNINPAVRLQSRLHTDMPN